MGGIMKRFGFLLLAAAMSGCVGNGVTAVETPRLDIRCPDPAERVKLAEGSTYRDLALSRAESLAGWTECHGALKIAGNR